MDIVYYEIVWRDRQGLPEGDLVGSFQGDIKSFGLFRQDDQDKALCNLGSGS